MNPAQIFSAIIAVIKADAAKALLGPIIAFLTAVKANGNPIAVAAAAAKFQIDLLAALPTAEIAVIQDIAQTVFNVVSSIDVPALPTAATAAPTVASSNVAK